MQQVWGASGDFWQSGWDSIVDLCGRNEALLAIAGEWYYCRNICLSFRPSVCLCSRFAVRPAAFGRAAGTVLWICVGGMRLCWLYRIQ